MSLNKISINNTTTVNTGIIYDISKETGQSYETLSDALSGNNVPPEVREGGMTVRFVHTGDNKYVQYMYMGTAVTGSPNPFLDTANWEKVNLINEVFGLERRTDVLGFSMSVSWVDGKYIRASNLVIGESTLWCYSSPIQVKSGDKIDIYTAGTNVSFITKCDYAGNFLSSLVSSSSSSSASVPVLYSYIMTEDTYIVICYKYAIAGAYYEINGIRNSYTSNAYKETEPLWEPMHQYSVGDKVEFQHIVCECVEAHTSTETFSYPSFSFIDNAGIDTINNEIVIGECKALKIVGMGTMGAGTSGVQKVGDIYYNTINNKLWLCTSFISSTNFTSIVIPFLDGAIYTYNDILYRWNGNALVKVIDVNINQNTGDNILKLNEVVSARLADADKLVKIKAFAPNAIAANINAEGECYYNTTSGELKKCLKWQQDIAHSVWEIVPFYNGAIYTCNNDLYLWNGEYLQSFSSIIYNQLRTRKIELIVEEHQGIIDLSGEIRMSETLEPYRYTNPVKVNKGEKIVVKSSTGGYAAISETDSSGSYYRCLVPSQVGGVNIEYSYYALEDMYLAFSYKDEGHELYSAIGSSIDEEEVEDIMYEKGIVINSITQIQSSEQSGGENVITFTLENGSTYNVVIRNGQQGPQGDTLIIGDEETYKLYNTLGNNTDGAVSQKVVTEKINEVAHLNDFFGGIYAYDFRTIANTDIWIYKDALFTGLKPVDNYEVFVPNSDSAYIKNYSKRALKFNSAAGNRTLHLQVRDIYNTVKFYKDISVVVKNPPSQKLSNEDHMNVFFFGDSIIGQNYNAIGAEFYRYLSTSNAGGTDSDGSIKPPAINICNSKLRLVGEMVHSGTNYQYLFQVASVLTGKRDIPYGDSAGNNKTYWVEHNPFYNPDSIEPDEIGADGFNKRVDFQWYFENACGVGKYPELIYMSIGANDIGTFDGYWSGASIDITAGRVIAVCKKMKSACDTIASGESGLKIKIFNHQSYPLDFASYNNLPIEQARCVQNRYYNTIVEKIVSENIGTYVELVDCASKFDIVNGYNMGAINTNSRTTIINDYGLLSGDGVHMNTVGAYQYADSLIRDFIADTDFD